jgi:hypothetical protein
LKYDKRPLLAILLRLFIGITFVAASIDKIGDPGKFATIIYGYSLFPGWIINPSAIVLPFVELFAGLALLLGVVPRSALMIITSLLFVFIVAITINLLRGHQFDCGCFSLSETSTALSAFWLLVRDLALFACAIYLLQKNQPHRSR